MQHEIQQERDSSRKQMYEKNQEIEQYKITISSHEQEIRRLRREIDDLEKQIRETHSSHSSSIVVQKASPKYPHSHTEGWY